LITFFTQIRPVLPLTLDPPVICFGKWIRWNDYGVPKNHNLKNVSAKNVILLSPTACLPAHLYPLGPPLASPFCKKFPFPAINTSPVAISSAATRLPASGPARRGPPDRSRAPAACAQQRPPRCAAVPPPDASTAGTSQVQYSRSSHIRDFRTSQVQDSRSSQCLANLKAHFTRFFKLNVSRVRGFS
jgi:hypothetical protein